MDFLMMNSTLTITHALGNLTAFNGAPVVTTISGGLWGSRTSPSGFEEFSLLYGNDRDLALTLSMLPPPPSRGNKYIEIIFTPLQDPPTDQQLWLIEGGVLLSEEPAVFAGRLQSMAKKDRYATPGDVSKMSRDMREVVAAVKDPKVEMQEWVFTQIEVTA